MLIRDRIIAAERNMKKEIKVLLTLEGSKFVSVNAMYAARVVYVGGKTVASIYKTTEAKKVASQIRTQLFGVDFSEYIDWLKETKQFELDLKFILKRKNTHFDVSNLIKLCEDAWVRFVADDLGIEGYDDSMHIKVVAEKRIIPGADHEYAVLILRESRANIRYDITPKPELINIFGWDLDKITAFLPSLPKRLLKKEKYQVAAEYSKADTKVYILQPTPFTPISPTLIPTIYKDILEAAYSEIGFVYVGIIGGKSEWQPSEWEQIEWLMNESKGNYRGIRVEEIEKQEDLLGWLSGEK